MRDDFSLTRHWPGWLIEDTGHIGIGGALSAYSVYWRPHKWDQFPAVDVFGDRTRWAIWRDHTPNPYRLGVSMPSRQGVKPADDVSWNADFSGGRQQVLHDVRTGPRAWPARAAWHVACVQQKKLDLQEVQDTRGVSDELEARPLRSTDGARERLPMNAVHL